MCNHSILCESNIHFDWIVYHIIRIVFNLYKYFSKTTYLQASVTYEQYILEKYKLIRIIDY